MKRKQTIRTRRLLWWEAILVPVLLVALLSLPSAASPGLDGPPAQPGDADDGPIGQVRIMSEWPLEVGVEYIGDYPGTSSDLPCAATNAWGLYNYLRNHGWCNFAGNNCYIWGNANAWEEDFKRTDLGGTNNSWVDSVDLVFYEGHGNPSLFTFKTPTGDCTHDDAYLTYNDARLAWGDVDAEWIALLSCSVLADSHQLDWAWTMHYLHLLLGFKTTAYDVCGFGQKFAEYIVANYTIPAAWFKACDQRQPAGVVAKVLAEEQHHFYDRQSYQYPDSFDNDYYWWTHTCGSEQARYVNPAQVGSTMPVFQTPPLDLETEARPMWNNLAGAFRVPTQTVSALQADNYWVSVSGGRELEMDNQNGLFYYIDHNRLFSATVSPQVQIMTAQDAVTTANQFLSQHGLMPGDAQFYEVVSETMEGVVQPGRITGTQLGAAEVVTRELAAYQVIYSRVLTHSVSAQQEPLEFSVVGPGAKIKVYVEPGGGQAGVATNGPPSVSGAMGGWRRIMEQPLGVQQVVPILSYQRIEQLFLQLEPEVALGQVPFDNPSHKEIITHTLGYWEEPSGSGQDQLYPAWVLGARYEGTVGGTTEPLVVTDTTYIPANQTYMRPLAKIVSHSDLGSNIPSGQVITFTAANASSPLNELGYHESLTFTLGSGGPYLYDWYLGSVANENRIGSGRELSYTVGLLREPGHGMPVPQTVILVVTDVGSSHAAQNRSVDSQAFNVVASVHLPAIQKNNP